MLRVPLELELPEMHFLRNMEHSNCFSLKFNMAKSIEDSVKCFEMFSSKWISFECKFKTITLFYYKECLQQTLKNHFK